MQYLNQSLNQLGSAILAYDYGHPWIYYYIVHSSMLCGSPIPEEVIKIIKKALSYCWNKQTGGFGGGYKQLPHLAPTYAAFLCIIDLGPLAYDLLDREGL